MHEAFVQDFWSVGLPGLAMVAGPGLRRYDKKDEKKTGVLWPAIQL
jgi:hypothetical protein